ncbi:MAG: hypothetical protein ACREOO_05705 [bacterium]
MAAGSSRVDPAVTQPVVALRPRDDLVLIEGIDPAIEMALNSIGIQKFSDLRGYSPESLSHVLQERTGIGVSAATIARLDWLGWAEILAAEETTTQAHAKEEEKKQEQQSRETLRAQEEERRDAISIESQQHAVEADEESIKEGAVSNVEAPDTEASEAAWAERSSATRASLRIKDARFATIEKRSAAGTPTTRMLRSEILCELAGITAAAEPTHLSAQLHAVHTHTGESVLLASQSRRLLQEHGDYRIALESDIPKAGLYQLQIIALLLEPDSRAAFQQGPVLRVLP